MNVSGLDNADELMENEMNWVNKKSAVMGLVVLFLFINIPIAFGQRKESGRPMFIDVNAIKLDMKKVSGEGQFTTQYSWVLANGNVSNEIWQYPQDEWHSRLLYQIFNPICPDNDGFINNFGDKKIIPETFVSNGRNVFSQEIRRYRPPNVTVDGIAQSQEYTWETDPDLKSDICAVWEDIIPFWGIRTHIEVYGFSHPLHENYLIWKATYKFTGETKTPLQSPDSSDVFPDQTMRIWWPLSFSFGPSKAGEYATMGGFAFEGQDDLDSWFARPSALLPGNRRDSLYVAYYWDHKTPGTSSYTNGSSDDTGDPDRKSGHLLSCQIPGFALLHAAKNSFEATDDDLTQPYSMPHADIENDLWGRRDFGLRDTYIGHDALGKFPLDPITEGEISASAYQYGPMRFITIGPYELEKRSNPDECDSICAVYAIGTGSISWTAADTIGYQWLKQPDESNIITDSMKNAIIMTGKDSLFQAIDRANWAWNRGFDIPDPPPPPDMVVTSDADKVDISWSYPSASYFRDPDTGIDDWYAWRVYRKKGAAWTNDPEDKQSGETWKLIYETTDRNVLTYVDKNVTRGVSYYYAVTAVDNGTQNPDDIIPNMKLESSRYVNRSALPAIPFKAGLSVSNMVRVVPNPATVNAGGLGFPGNINQILFAKLPYICNLKVYTETGDFITEIDHFGTDQEIWDQRTDSNQYVASGIYILVVTKAESVDGKKLPDQYVKFVLVR